MAVDDSRSLLARVCKYEEILSNLAISLFADSNINARELKCIFQIAIQRRPPPFQFLALLQEPIQISSCFSGSRRSNAICGLYSGSQQRLLLAFAP